MLYVESMLFKKKVISSEYLLQLSPDLELMINSFFKKTA